MKRIFIFLFFLLLFSCCSYVATKDDTKNYPKAIKENDSISVIQKESEKKEIVKIIEYPKTTGEKTSPSPPPPPPPAPVPSVVEDIIQINPQNDQYDETKTLQDAVDNIGKINYVIQDTMVIGITNEVNMTISGKEVEQKVIIDGVSTFNEHNIYTSDIRITPIMKARLVDPTGVNFRIIPTTEEEQFLEKNDYTLWTWNVTPLTKGNNKLSLSVDVIVNDKSKNIKVYDGIIYVYSDETIISKIINFLTDNWEFIVGTILIPLLVYMYSKIKKRRR